MLHFIELVIAFSLIIILVPQNKNDNMVFRKLYETGFFISPNETKTFLKITTWILISSFFLFLLLLNIQW